MAQITRHLEILLGWNISEFLCSMDIKRMESREVIMQHRKPRYVKSELEKLREIDQNRMKCNEISSKAIKKKNQEKQT